MNSQALSPARRRKVVEDAALHLARKHPDWGQARVAQAIVEKGLKISAGGVRWIWQRHGLETAVKRAAALRRLDAKSLDAQQESALARISERMGGRTEGRPPAKAREHLLAIAVHEFNRKGFTRASIREIARAAGLQPGSVYHHFASKDELFIAAHSVGMRQSAQILENALAGRHDPWERLEIVCALHIEHLVSGRTLTVWTADSLYLFDSPDIQLQLRSERDIIDALYRRLIAALPLPADIDRSLLRLQLLGALNWTRTWYQAGKRTPGDIARHLVRLIRRGASGSERRTTAPSRRN